MNTVLELTVTNHPGTMSHIAGLFARRGFNVDGILCLPFGDGSQSRIWLRVQETDRLIQLIHQLEKLVDVQSVRRHTADHEVIQSVESFFTQTPG